MAPSSPPSRSCLPPFYTIPIFLLFNLKDFSFTCISMTYVICTLQQQVMNIILVHTLRIDPIIKRLNMTYMYVHVCIYMYMYITTKVMNTNVLDSFFLHTYFTMIMVSCWKS